MHALTTVTHTGAFTHTLVAPKLQQQSLFFRQYDELYSPMLGLTHFPALLESIQVRSLVVELRRAWQQATLYYDTHRDTSSVAGLCSISIGKPLLWPAIPRS